MANGRLRHLLKNKLTGCLIGFAILNSAAAISFARRPSATISAPALRAAAAYLDNRLDWWVHWPNAARDHDTSCVSCHTALPYALARPALHRALEEHEAAIPERKLLANVGK